MQFNPLFFPQPNSLEEKGEVKSFKLSGSTYLFADILKVYTEKENNLIETEPSGESKLLGNSFSQDPVNNLTSDSNGKSQSSKTTKPTSINENHSLPLNLQSIYEMIENLSYPLTKKEIFKSPDNSKTTEGKNYLSGVELEEIIKKIAYLTGTINYNQFFSTDENFISVKDNKDGEVQLSTKEILDILNANVTTKIRIENNEETLKIELTKRELQNSNYNSDFILFNEDTESVPNIESTYLKTDTPNKIDDNKNYSAETNLSSFPSKNINEKFIPDNSFPESSAQEISDKGINSFKQVYEVNNSLLSSEKDIQNHVYEVKLELVNNSFENEETSNGNEILLKIITPKDIKTSLPENKFNEHQFFNNIKSREDRTDLSKTFLPSDKEKVSKEKELFNFVERVINKKVDNLEITSEKGPVLQNNKKIIDVVFKQVNNSEAEYIHKSTPPLADEPEKELSTKKQIFSPKVILPEKNEIAEKVMVNSKPVKPNLNKEPEPEKNDNELIVKTEKQQVQKLSLKNSTPDFSQRDSYPKNESQNQQDSFLTPSFEKITESKIISVNNSLGKIEESIKTISVSEIIEEVSKLAESDKEKSIVLKLFPENLGKVKVSLNISEHIVHANFEVENESVRNLIQNNSLNLKNSLMQQGLQLNSMNISLANYEQKTSKSFSPKRKTGYEKPVSKIDEKENQRISKSLGYNTYEYLI